MESKDFLSPNDCKDLFKRIELLGSGKGETSVYLISTSIGAAKWARSQLNIGYETSNIAISIRRNIKGAAGSASTTRLDDDGLREAIRAAETALLESTESPQNIVDSLIDEPIATPILWSSSTNDLTAEARGDLARQIMEPAESEGLLSAGKLEISAQGHASMNSKGLFRYYAVTDVQCSVTVRNKKGTGSGWAAGHNYDLAKLDVAEISSVAMDKCIRSQYPVAVEPGRYTVIMEPQATADLFTPVLERSPGYENPGFIRPDVESGDGPFYKSRGQSKITERVLDRRLTLSADPMDPEAGFVPFTATGEPYLPVKWIDNGILKELSYGRTYALRVMGKPSPLPNSLSYRLSGNGPVTSIEEMIRTTDRGILVTRFSGIEKVDSDSLLLTGFTRDGMWLIEQGKITKAIKNFKFTESPLFVLNNTESLGEPKRTFSPPTARVAPAVKVRDFSFTSLADAV